MATTIQCSHCGQAYDLTDEQVPQYAGQTITCTRCQRPFTVPADLAGGGAGVARAVAPPAAVSGTAPTYAEPMPASAAAGHYSMEPAGPRQSNGFAIASLICGILGCTGIGGILAIIFGIIGVQKASNDPRVGGKGMALAGIILGAVLMLGPCLISILLPSLNRAREQANRVKCASNLRQIGQAMQIYASMNKGYLPPNLAALVPIGTQTVTFTCPSTNDTAAPNAGAMTMPGTLSYIYLYDGRAARLRDLGNPARMPVVHEPLTNHDNNGMNVLFADGHVEFVPTAQAQAVLDRARAAPPAGQEPKTPTGARGI